jgi:rubrerythrin
VADIQQHLASSHKVEFEDLDWGLARRSGLSPREAEMLQYFADIESQTVFYMLEVAKLEVARDPELLAFLTMWNYEEYFHSHAISRLLKECGVEAPPPMKRATSLRAKARVRARVEDFVQQAMARTMPRAFVSLWMAWGAAQELLTTQAYEEIARTTKNPVLAELFRRIAKQERRHFAYYYTSARERLEGFPAGQKLVRLIFERNFNPVGSGLKSPAEQAAFISNIFPKRRLFEAFGEVDDKMEALPGLRGMRVATAYCYRIQPMLSADARWTPNALEGGAQVATEPDAEPATEPRAVFASSRG